MAATGGLHGVPCPGRPGQAQDTLTESVGLQQVHHETRGATPQRGTPVTATVGGWASPMSARQQARDGAARRRQTGTTRTHLLRLRRRHEQHAMRAARPKMVGQAVFLV